MYNINRTDTIVKYLITGGAGFIGGHLCELLIGEGHNVTVIDDLSTGSLKNLAKVTNHPNFRFVLGSVETSLELGALITWADVVYHLAAAVGVDLVVKEPVQTIETNVHGTENVLKYAALSRTKMIMASTSEVYGRAQNPTFSEEDDLVIGPPTHSRWSYAASKALDEYLTLAYHKQKHMNAVIVRFFNTVGPRQTGQYGMVLPRFVKAALAGDPIRVFGTGEQTRCFCHVRDVINGLRAVETCEKADGEIFNIGRPSPISINDLAKQVIKITESKSEILHIPYSEAYEPGFEDMERRVPSIAKIQSCTNWQPKLDLDTIISEVRDYFETNPES